MSTTLKIKRGTISQLNAAASAQTLNQGEPYLITDEARMAIGTANNTFVKLAKLDEVQAIDADLTAISGLTGTGILTRSGPDTWYLDTNTYLTGNESISITGDATGSGTTAITLTLGNTGVTAGTYTKITVDSKGRATAGTTLLASDIPTLTASKISDFDTQVRTSRLDQMSAPTAAVDYNGQKITGLANPTNAQDAATKIYVDNAVQGLDPKASVKAATTANITLSGTQTIDGVALSVGDRVLVKNQSTANQNGIYTVASGAWTRTEDADAWNELVSAYVFVEEGTTNADNGFLITVDAGGTLGVTDITITQFNATGQIIAGAGLTKTGNQLDVGGTANRITVNADTIDIASTYVGQSSITTLGTIGTGEWQGTAVAVAYGGTGRSTFTTNGIVYGNGTSQLQVTAAGADGYFLYSNAGTPAWTNVVDGGTF